MQSHIYVKGARAHNLKNIDVSIPRDKMVVITGLSGSGKSSLAFDTIYAEGQRRYVESLSSYARMFLGQMEKPDVDYIDGLSPAISIDAAEGVEEIPPRAILIPGRIRNIVGKPQLGYAVAHFELGIELDVDFHSHYSSRRAHLAPFYISLSRPSSIDLSAIR